MCLCMELHVLKSQAAARVFFRFLYDVCGIQLISNFCKRSDEVAGIVMKALLTCTGMREIWLCIILRRPDRFSRRRMFLSIV